MDLSNGSEMCKYMLDDMSQVNESNTLVMCKLFRQGGNNDVWRLQALGFPLFGPPTAVELSRTNALDQYAFKLPVFSPVPPPDKTKRPRRRGAEKSDACCSIM